VTRESPSPAGATGRIHSIDVVRGLVMVLMAIDHVRVYAGVPAWSAEPATFFTRWVTHFCAPAFVFLAGTSAFLSGRRIGPTALGRKLLVRGALLILLELTLVRVAWTFNLDFGRYLLAGVLWMIGWCMILMAPLVRLPLPAIASFGVLMIAGHNLSALLPQESVRALLAGGLGWLFRSLYFGGGIALGGGDTPNLFVLYSLVPWLGVMAAGYAFGRVVCLDPQASRRACLWIGLGSIAGFLVLRAFNLYGDWSWAASAEMPGWLAFLNTSKYPASLLFLLMTLGPTIAAMPLPESAHGRLAGWLAVFGRVPFAYYLMHIPLIHAVALAISLLRTPLATGWLFHDHPLRPGPVPDGYMWSLGLLYAVTALVVVVLYFPCRSFAELKARRAHPWLSYL
jgi:uncharacterized membrane protein